MRRLVWLALIIPFALITEDSDSRMCTDVGGVVIVDEYPRQRTIYRCIIDGKPVRSWMHGRGENILIWGY
jgi:hypothetical protein